MIEANIHQIKEGISQIKNLLYCMDKFIKEIEKGLDENSDENIDKIMFEDMCKELDRENKKLKENISWYEKEEDRLKEQNKKLEAELDKLKSTYVYDAKQVRDVC